VNDNYVGGNWSHSNTVCIEYWSYYARKYSSFPNFLHLYGDFMRPIKVSYGFWLDTCNEITLITYAISWEWI